MVSKRYMFPPESMIGKEFGSLTVIALDVEATNKNGKSRHYLCKCDCGNDYVACGTALRSGVTSRCFGCFKGAKEKRRAASQKIGKYRIGHPIWNDWMVMRRQCSNPHHPGYKYYGALGIKTCDSWKSFRSFCEDMGEDKPINTFLVRIDTKKDFTKENCRWGRLEETEHYKRRNERSKARYYARKKRLENKEDDYFADED